YSLMHAFGAAFDNPDLMVACIVGDGEAETGPLAGSWLSNVFLSPVRDGTVLPILHLNGYKIAGPTVLARIPTDDLLAMMRGFGWEPHLVAGDDPAQVHQEFAGTLDRVFDDIAAIRESARAGRLTRPRWPMVILRTPKGWTGPSRVDGTPVEGTWRSHQVPLPDARTNPQSLRALEQWLRSYHPEELFDPTGAPAVHVRAQAPAGRRRMSA